MNAVPKEVGQAWLLWLHLIFFYQWKKVWDF